MASSKKIIEIRGTEISAQGGETKQVPSMALPPEEKEFLRQYGKYTYELRESLQSLSARVEKSGKDWEKINDSLGHLAANWVNPAELEKERQRREDANLGISSYSGSPGRSPKYASEAERQRQEAEFDKSFGAGSAPTQEVSTLAEKLQKRLEELAQGLKGATGGIGTFGRLAEAAAKALGGSGGSGTISGGFGGGIAGIGGGGMSFKSAGGGLIKMLGLASGSLGKIGIVALVASMVIGKAFKVFKDAFDKASEVITNWSGAVASAQAAGEARKTRDLLSIANRKGDEFAAIVNATNNLQSAIREISAEFLDFLAEPFAIIVNALAIIIRFLSVIIGLFNTVINFIVEVLSAILDSINYLVETVSLGLISLDWIIGKIKSALGIMNKNDQNLQQNIDDLFGSARRP